MTYLLTGCATHSIPSASNAYVQKYGSSVKSVSSDGYMAAGVFDLGVALIANVGNIKKYNQKAEAKEHLASIETTYDENGYNVYGYNKQGFNKQGYNKLGFNPDGYDRNGFNQDGIHQKTKTQFNESGFNSEGYNSRGYSYSGFNKNGLNENNQTIDSLIQLKKEKINESIIGNFLGVTSQPDDKLNCASAKLKIKIFEGIVSGKIHIQKGESQELDGIIKGDDVRAYAKRGILVTGVLRGKISDDAINGQWITDRCVIEFIAEREYVLATRAKTIPSI